MLVRIAIGNLRRSLRDYSIYFLTIVMGVAVFYAFNTISLQADFLSESTSSAIQLVAELISGLTVFLAVVLGFLMVYANNFLVRRRKEEFGLYQVLGMTRGQVSLIMSIETLATGVVAFACGIALGVLISQFLVFVSAALFNDTVTQFRFLFSPEAVGLVAVCWAVTSLVMLVFNLHTISRVRLVSLMEGSRRNESQRLRNRVLCWVLVLAGLAMVIWAYVRLTTDGLPVDMDDAAQMGRFGVTTALVTAGTFLLFWAAPTCILQVLSAIKGLYYRDLNMFTMRQVSSRINSASISMAFTAMILFLAMTSVTGGMSISTGLNKGLDQATPFTATLGMVYFDRSMDGREFGGAIVEAAQDPVSIMDVLGSKGIEMPSEARYAQANLREVPLGSGEGLSMATLAAAAGEQNPALTSAMGTRTASLDVETISDYNRTRELLGLDPVTLGDDRYLISCNTGNVLADRVYRPALERGVSFTLAGRVLHPADEPLMVGAASAIGNSSFGDNTGTLVVPDELVDGLIPYVSELQVMADPGDATQVDERLMDQLGGSSSSEVDYGVYDGDGDAVGYLNGFHSEEEMRAGSFSMTGLVGYLATYIGFVLVVSCAAVLAIQQLSGMTDSLGRYGLLSELGAPVAMIDRSVAIQALIYFLAPLVVALAHSAVALKQVVDVVALLAPIDLAGSLALPLVIFLVVFGGYLLITYLLSRSMVEARLVDHGRR